jgi:hypothetical protein
VLDTAEIADDRRQRRRHDGLIQRDQQRDQHQGREDQRRARLALAGGRRARVRDRDRLTHAWHRLQPFAASRAP